MQAQDSSALNPRLPMLFRIITSVEWLVLGVTGFGLFLLPTVASSHWPWQVKWIGLFVALMLTGIVMIVFALGKLLVQQQGQKRWADGSASK